MGNKGFILPFTMIVLSFVLSIFYLFNLSLNSKVSLNLLEENDKVIKSNFANMDSIVKYEFEFMSDYIRTGKIKGIDDYFFFMVSGEELWRSKETREGKSIGGYYIVNIFPRIESLTIGREEEIEIDFNKKIEIIDEYNEIYMTVKIKLEKIKMKCTLLNNEKEMDCEVIERDIENIKVEAIIENNEK